MFRMKERITISVDPEALETVRAEVKAGRADSVSAAIEEMLLAASRRQALKDLLDEMDAEYGPLTEEEKEWGEREVERVFGKGVFDTASSSTPER